MEEAWSEVALLEEDLVERDRDGFILRDISILREGDAAVIHCLYL
jgi:hypothetical protein